MTDQNCSTKPLLWMLAALLSVSGCSCDSKPKHAGAAADGGGAGNGVVTLECAKDAVVCQGSVAKVCDGNKGFTSSTDCSKQKLQCLSSQYNAAGTLIPLGCVQCTPGQASCADGKASLCREDGTGFHTFDCDPMQGMTCEADGCKGVCAPPQVTASYIGCDYYPTVTLNPVWSGFDFAVAVANASDTAAHLVVTSGDMIVHQSTIEVGALEVVKLDWVTALKGGDQDACQVPPDPGDSRLVKKGAYRLRTDHPVTVYQFSPLQYQLGTATNPPTGCPTGTKCPGGIVAECLSYSNDASLLFPATTLSGDYTVMSWPSHGNTASFFAVTATADTTTVSLKGHGSFRPGGGVDATGQGSIMLNRGDVLEVVSSHGDNTDDASGSLIHADKPVQVIAGQSCGNVPSPDTAACDHLEHALFPTQILGSDYVVSYPAAVASESPHVFRIAAVTTSTTITFEPAVSPPIMLGPNDPPFQLQVGSFTPDPSGGRGTEIKPVDVRITSDKPISIVQYMQGQASVPSGAGDPSMAMVVPVKQYRSDYTFTASTTYDSNFINVIAPIGTTITLDDQPLDGTVDDVGQTNLHVIRTQLPSGGSGTHHIHGDAAFGLVVYGYGRYTSYMYPGGLDLNRITFLSPQ